MPGIDGATDRPTYEFRTTCFNCHHRVTFTIPKGVTAQAYLSGAPCPMCGCSPVKGTTWVFTEPRIDRKPKPWWRR